MSSLLEGLTYDIAHHAQFVQTVTGSRRAVLRAWKYFTVIHVSKCYFFFTNGNGKFVFTSSVLFTEEADENDTQRKKLKTDINERQLNYTSKMKKTRKRGPKFHVDEYVSIKIDAVDKMSPLHPNV